MTARIARQFATVIIALQTTLLMPQAEAQGNCEGKWARLSVYAGSYDIDPVLNDSEVSVALTKMLGSERAHLLENLNVGGVIDLISCNLVIDGNAAHRGGEENAVLVLKLFDGTITAGMLTEGRIRIFTGSESYANVPLPLKDWIAVVNSEFRFRFDPPANADLIIIEP
jgi:hypothetical protein